MKAILLAIGVWVWAASASASEIHDQKVLDISVEGTIPAHCEIGDVPDMDFGNLERPGLGIEARIPFDCNVPFSLVIKGSGGALVHETMRHGQGPYAGELPYYLHVDLPLRFPNLRHLSREFPSRQLLAGGVISSNGGIATDGLKLAIELGAPASEAGLLAGNYSETVTITVSAI